MGFEELHSADQLGKDAAPINIAHQQYGGSSVGGYGHIDNLIRFEVEFGGTPCALNHDHLILLTERIKAVVTTDQSSRLRAA